MMSHPALQGLEPREYEKRKEATADTLVKRLEAFLPGLHEATIFREVSVVLVIPILLRCTLCFTSGAASCLQVGTPRTHRRFLNRDDGSYGPIPARRPLGMLGMPFNRTSVKVCCTELWHSDPKISTLCTACCKCHSW